MWPSKLVVRRIQGVSLVLPWSHRLPDYAEAFPAYGQNLVALARLLKPASEPLRMLDVGANVGDSALQVLKKVDARILCVEGDPYWLEFLRRNVCGEERVSVEASLLVPSDGQPAGLMSAVREAGTTHFVPSESHDALEHLAVTQLRSLHPSFSDVRLVKSDTDGYEVSLVPALADAWSASKPVLFFEYDPRLSRTAGFERPEMLWQDLSSRGYRDVALWDNTGAPLGRSTADELQSLCRDLDTPPAQLGYQYWDVAAAHDRDEVAQDALRRLVPGIYSGSTRTRGAL